MGGEVWSTGVYEIEYGMPLGSVLDEGGDPAFPAYVVVPLRGRDVRACPRLALRLQHTDPR